ncbi:hypothetical protein IP84_01535 [beta proteobacterium AAP99]|nr:hypothetical protein IP84_01535 [beta proteobacterium AAP99]
MFSKTRKHVMLAAWLTGAACSAAYAAEGVHPLHDVPVDAISSTTGVTLTPQWLENARLAAGRFGSSSGFVSADGLVITNHHVAEGCLFRLSATRPTIYRDGYLAATREQEIQCPGADVTVLESFENVTQRVTTGPENARAARIVGIERECSEQTKLSCEVVTLYRGAEYWVYRYRRINDVRLVWAPERTIGLFGGDRDNFVYPRYNLDVALLRAYADGKPYRPARWFRVAPQGVKEGEPVFAIGNPGSTSRHLTVADARFQAQSWLPLQLELAKREIEALKAYSARSPQAAAQAESNLFGTQNYFKTTNGAVRRMQSEEFWQTKQEREKQVRAAVPLEGDDPWKQIEAAVQLERKHGREITAISGGWRTLLATAYDIVDLAFEQEWPAEQRLKAFSAASVQRLSRRLTAQAPFHPQLEALRVQLRLEASLDALGKDHAFIRTLLAGQTPANRAQTWAANTGLGNVDLRRQLVEGGAAAVRASSDPLIVVAREAYAFRRQVRLLQENQIAAVKERAYDRITRMERAAKLPGLYPDATGSMRLSWGYVRGYDRDGVWTAWATTLHGLYERSAVMQGQPDRADFELPKRWQDARGRLKLDTPLNFVNDLDIIGGSSGSPVLNAAGELVGVQFDGNIEQTGNQFGYDSREARAIAVDVRAMLEALRVVYGADALVNELLAR